jgi:uncharacterized membrane protein
MARGQKEEWGDWYRDWDEDTKRRFPRSVRLVTRGAFKTALVSFHCAILLLSAALVYLFGADVLATNPLNGLNVLMLLVFILLIVAQVRTPRARSPRRAAVRPTGRAL